jgi:hypothetical protein
MSGSPPTRCRHGPRERSLLKLPFCSGRTARQAHGKHRALVRLTGHGNITAHHCAAADRCTARFRCASRRLRVPGPDEGACRRTSAVHSKADANSACWPPTQCANKRHRAAYSITSSAMASTPGGMARPSAFAVSRLMTSSNFVGSKIGRSAGLAPLTICAA